MTNSLKSQIRRFLPRSLRPHSILAGPLRGASIYTSWHDYPGAILGTTEKPLLQWFHRNVLPGETWIDIGAHYGYTAIALCRLVGPAGRVVAFEPVLSTAGCIARTRELNACASCRSSPWASAPAPPSRPGVCLLVRGMADSTISPNAWEEPISIASFDTVWRVLCEQNPAVHGVKIDVQGMELEVIEGHAPHLALLASQADRRVSLRRRPLARPRPSRRLRLQRARRPHRIRPRRASPYQDDKSYLFLNECAALSVS